MPALNPSPERGGSARSAGVGSSRYGTQTPPGSLALAALPLQGRDKKILNPPAAVLTAVGNAGFFQIQFVFDAPPCFVGDLAVA